MYICITYAYSAVKCKAKVNLFSTLNSTFLKLLSITLHITIVLLLVEQAGMWTVDEATPPVGILRTTIIPLFSCDVL